MKTSLFHLLCYCLAASIAWGQQVISEADTPPAESAESTEATPPPAAVSAPSADEPAIPVPFPVQRYEASWKKNPFLLVTTPIMQPKNSFADDWTLAGMFNNQGRIQVTIENKQTQDKRVLANDGKEVDGFRLIKANFHRNRNEASAEVAKGSETAELKYDETITSRPLTINNTQRPPTVPGQPGAVPGRPGQPVAPGGAPAVRAGQPGGVQAMVTNPATGQPYTGAPVAVAPGAMTPGQPAPRPTMNQPGTVVAPTMQNLPPTISRRRQLIPPSVVPQQ